MGVDPLHFAKVNYSSARNDFGGFNNVPNYANKTASPAYALPHAVIEPSALRAAKAYLFE
jgi:hypothetical protein